MNAGKGGRGRALSLWSHSFIMSRKFRGFFFFFFTLLRSTSQVVLSHSSWATPGGSAGTPLLLQTIVNTGKGKIYP